MRIEDIADIYQGITLSRIKNKDTETKKCLVYSFVDEEKNYIDVPKDRELRTEIPFTKKDMVLLNLTSHRASIIEEYEEGMIIPSTFIILSANKKVNPEYLEWYINEDSELYKSLQVIKQGSIVLTIPIQSFREIKIKLPSIEEQNKIGRINKLIKLNKKLSKEKEGLLKSVLKYINQEEIKYDK